MIKTMGELHLLEGDLSDEGRQLMASVARLRSRVLDDQALSL